MNTAKPTRLQLVALLYLTFPLFLFFIGWCSWFVAVPIIAFLVYLFTNIHKQVGRLAITEKVQLPPLFITGLFAFVWVATTGVWRLGFGRSQDWDVMRNDLLSTLTTIFPVCDEYTSTDKSVRTKSCMDVLDLRRDK